MTTQPLGVVIPNFDGRTLLRECLEALQAEAATDLPLDVLVVDNGSSDGSVAMIGEDFPSVRVVVNQDNLGFTPAINQGMAATRSEWVLLLNNDAILTAGALRCLVTAAHAGPASLAAVQPLLVAADDPNKIDSAGIGIGPRFRTFDRFMGDVTDRVSPTPIEVWGGCAACLLVRRTAFDRAGGFDDDFFVELDDVDFAFRARWLGYTFLFEPRSIVRHYRSSSAPRHVRRKLGRVRRNGLLTLFKNYPGPGLIGIVMYRAQRDLFLLLHYLRRSEARAILGAWSDAFRLWPKMRRKRRASLEASTLSESEMRKQLDKFARSGGVGS